MLINFLTDVISNMDVFRDDIATIYLDRRAGKQLTATGNHPKRLLFYKAEPVEDLPDAPEAPAYLGALGYLNSVLSASMMRESPVVEIIYREHDGKKHCVEALKFTAKRFDSHFQCTNPNILNEKDRLKQFGEPKDAVFFPFDKIMRKEFEEAARCNTPKADIRLFTLAYDGCGIRATFGAGTHTTSLLLTDKVSGHLDQKFNRQVSLDRFRQMVKLASENKDSTAGFHPTAFWIDFQTLHAAHKIVTPTIREAIGRS